MKIIIAGAGEVGFHLAKLLSFESQNITLIDTSREALAHADTHLDIRVVRGDSTSIAVLKDSRVDETDLVIAVTSSETTNIVCSPNNWVQNVLLPEFQIPNLLMEKMKWDLRNLE
jgi:trk system potassium uptake protein TrkA